MVDSPDRLLGGWGIKSNFENDKNSKIRKFESDKFENEFQVLVRFNSP